VGQPGTGEKKRLERRVVLSVFCPWIRSIVFLAGRRSRLLGAVKPGGTSGDLMTVMT